MKKLKLVLKIVGVLGIAFWTVCCFLGLFFANNGNTMAALPIALLIGVLMVLSYFLMLKMQDKESRQSDAKRAKTMEIVWLCVYLVTMLFSAFYVNHLVNTYDSREEIRAQASDAIDELKVTFATSDAINNSYREWVSAELVRYQLHVDDNPELYQGDHNLLWIDFEDKLLASGYENLESRVNYCLDQVKATVIDNWYLPTLLQRLKELTHKEEWEQQVVEFSQGHEYTREHEAFQPVSNYNCYGITSGLTTTSFRFSGISILIMVALQIIILLGFLISIKLGGGRDKIKTSETGAIRSWTSVRQQDNN